MDIKDLEVLYSEKKHQNIIDILTKLDPNELTYMLKLHLARAYVNTNKNKEALLLLIKHKGFHFNNDFWNYISDDQPKHLWFGLSASFYYSQFSQNHIESTLFSKNGDPKKTDIAIQNLNKAKEYNNIALQLKQDSEFINKQKAKIDYDLNEINASLEKSKTPKPKKVKISKDEYDAKYEKIFDDYFDKISSDPLKLHRTIDSWNWDEDYKYLFLIAKNKNTDLGTALMLFWQGQPQDYWLPYKSVSEVEKHNKESFQLTELLYQNIMNDFYTKGSIAYNPKNDYGTDWTENYSKKNSPKKLSSVFFEKTIGKKIKSNYTEGFPNKIWNKVDELEEQFYYE